MSTAAGVIVGLVLFLAMAVTSIVAVNGIGIRAERAAIQSDAAAGATRMVAVEPPPEPEGDKSKSLRSLDLDGDGRLSLAEAAGYAEIVQRFHRADRDRDGKLTQSEFDRLAKLPPPKAAKKKPVRRPQTTPPPDSRGP
jgi:EF hand